jgi:hypothetical protein
MSGGLEGAVDGRRSRNGVGPRCSLLCVDGSERRGDGAVSLGAGPTVNRTPPPATPAPDPKAAGKLFVGCLRIVAEIVAVVLAVALLPFIILGCIVHFAWPWYSSLPPPPSPATPLNINDALIALASVAGVLWSGAVVAYSIHRRYTPPLRTGVQLLNFAIIAPLIGLMAEGAALRTTFYFVMVFFVLSFLLSTTSVEMLKPGKFTLKVPDPKPNETPVEKQLREQLAAAKVKDIDLFRRVAHGTRYFGMVAILCLAVFITASVVTIEWSCLLVLVVSLFLMLPEIFYFDDPGTP